MNIKKRLTKLADLDPYEIALNARLVIEDLESTVRRLENSAVVEEENLAYADFIFSLRAYIVNNVGKEFWTRASLAAYSNLEKLGIDASHINTEYPEDEDK